MAVSRQARAGFPISVKLVVATSLVVAAAVGTATWFSTTSTTELTRHQIDDMRKRGERAMVREAELAATGVAKAVAVSVGGSAVEDVEIQVDDAMREDLEDLRRERARRGLALEPAPRHLEWLVITLPCQGAAPCVGRFFAASDRAISDAARDHGGDPAGGDLRARRAKLGASFDLAGYRATLAAGERDGVVSYGALGDNRWIYHRPIVFGGNTVGELWMGVTTQELADQLDTALADADRYATEKRNRALLVSLVVLAIGIVLAALQGVQLARPIKMLTAQAQRIASGDLRLRVPENRHDELGVLARTFNVMADEITALLAQQAEQVSLQKEMELARQVQQAMLPPTALDQHGALKVAGYCMPASSCGGDWWTYRKLSNGRMLLVVGDATGHGIHSAMIAATARGAVEALSGIDERLLTPEQVLRAIDSAIRQVGDHNVIMTAFAAVFDSTSGILHYANAGQNFPYVIKLDGATRVLGEASIIAASGNPLGDRNIKVEIRRGSLQLRPGDLFVCFTDGVVERANPAGKLFGDRRLRGALTGQPLPDGDALLRLRDDVVRALDRYAEGALAADDITLVLCQYDPPAARTSAGRGAA